MAILISKDKKLSFFFSQKNAKIHLVNVYTVFVIKLITPADPKKEKKCSKK
jgi:hypothetical protein